MFLYMEWVISICSIFILWWKFGWKSLTVMKKMEDIVFPITTKPKNHSSDSSSTNNEFLNLPVVRTQFTPKVTKVFSEGQNGVIMSNGKSPTTIRSQTELLSLRHRKQRRIIGPTRQTSCTACSQHKVKNRHLHDKDDLRDSLHCETHLAHNPWYIRRFASIVHYWRKWYLAYQYHMVSLKDMMSDTRVNAAVQEVARMEFQENPNSGSIEAAIRKQKLRAERITTNLRAIQDMKYFRYFSRFAIWFIAKVLSRIYPKILVRQSQLESLRKARESGYRLIYLPIHRSHIDYVLISWILSSNDIRSPLVAAGDNLNIPIFNKMMRSVGGFFIKRQMDQKDILYRAILHSYMERTILDDNDLEFFVEGGRTRSGKPGLPKGGLLNIAMDTLFSGQVEDMLIVPVNFSYEKLIEGNYIREQLGKPKVNESFLAAVLGVWNSCQTKFGNARIDFGQPFSVKDFMNSYKSWNSPANANNLQLTYITDENDNNVKDTNKDLNIYREGRLCRSNSFALSGTSANDTTIIEDRRNFINCLAQHVIYDGLKCFSLMSTNVLAFILLNKYRSGVTLDKLAAEMHTLKLEFLERKHDVNLDGDMKDVIVHALNILGPTLVSQEIIHAKGVASYMQGSPGEVFLKPNTAVPNVIDLAYYSTCVTPLYAMEAVVATSLLVLAKPELSALRIYPQEIHVSDYELVSTCMELCDILEYEFIFHPPCQTLEQAIRNNLEYMKTQGIIRFKHSQICEGADASSYLKTNTIQLLLTKENHERLKFLYGLLQSILDNYAVSSLVLKRLIGHEAKEKQLQMDMLAEVKYHLQKKMIAYGESLALDPIRNFIRVLLEWQVLESSTKERVVTYSLQEPFDNEPTVYDLIRKIRRFQV